MKGVVFKLSTTDFHVTDRAFIHIQEYNPEQPVWVALRLGEHWAIRFKTRILKRRTKWNFQWSISCFVELITRFYSKIIWDNSRRVKYKSKLLFNETMERCQLSRRMRKLGPPCVPKHAAAGEASDSQKPASELKSGKPRGKNQFNDNPQWAKWWTERF